MMMLIMVKVTMKLMMVMMMMLMIMMRAMCYRARKGLQMMTVINDNDHNDY